MKVLTTLIIHTILHSQGRCTHGVTVTSFNVKCLSPPCWRYTMLLLFSQTAVCILFVVCRATATGSRSRGILSRQPAINNKLTPKPTPKPNPNPNLTLAFSSKKRKTDRQITNRLPADAILPVACGLRGQSPRRPQAIAVTHASQ